ncbi:spore germination protein [Mesobacillus maritimus]|uniref:Spore germination protein n=1 Tax=Mesobacillus maritimus TaxID=1643336 RepID=A0ABS7KBC0_9BACI|nr:spore germination protein [Mesobacillus maritimus]MBY0099380.1 spore germination protein [Mesobacillus maritimus]
MPYQINILNLKVNGANQNGNIDVGPTVHNSHTANSKFIGANISMGDFSPTSSVSSSGTIDTDVSDQDQIANPSMPIANQI